MTEKSNTQVPAAPVAGSNFGVLVIAAGEDVLPEFAEGDTVVEVVSTGAT